MLQTLKTASLLQAGKETSTPRSCALHNACVEVIFLHMYQYATYAEIYHICTNIAQMHNMHYMYIYDKYEQYAEYAQGPGLPAYG